MTNSFFQGIKKELHFTVTPWLSIVGVAGFEPTTPCSQSRCANRTALHPVGSGMRDSRCEPHMRRIFRLRGTKIGAFFGWANFFGEFPPHAAERGPPIPEPARQARFARRRSGACAVRELSDRESSGREPCARALSRRHVIMPAYGRKGTAGTAGRSGTTGRRDADRQTGRPGGIMLRRGTRKAV